MLATKSSDKFFKILNKDRNHNGFQYKIGLNVLPQGEKFARIGSCVPGGFYYTTAKHILNFLNYGEDLFEIRIPANAQIRKDNGKWRTDKIILGNHYSLFDFSTYKMLEEMGASVDINSNECIGFAAKHGSIPLFNFFKGLITCYISISFYRENTLVAIKYGQLSFVEAIADKVDEYFNDAVCSACMYGRLNIVEFLIERNPDYEYKYSHINFATQGNHLDIIKFLIKKYPENNHSDLILREASKKGHLDIVQQFTNIDNSSYFVDYACIAASNGHLSVLKYFVELGVDVTANCVEFRHALNIASKRKYNDVIKYLIENTVGKVDPIKTYTKCVILSASVCNTEIFKLGLNILIKNGITINQVFLKKTRKLMKCISILKLAIDLGFQPSHVDLSKSTTRAIIRGDLSLAEYLIKLDNKPQIPSYFFYDICASDNLPMIKLFVENCYTNDEKQICINKAAKNNHINIVNYLIEKFNPSSDMYTNILKNCVASCDLDIVKLLVNLGARIEVDTITKAIKCGHLDVIEYFVENGMIISNDLITVAIDADYDNIAEYFEKKISFKN